MKYCSKCGKEIMDKAVVCPGCGCAQENNVQNNVQGNSVPQIKEALSDIQKEVWSNSEWSLLGFFILIVGLILYLAYKNSANNFFSVKMQGVTILKPCALLYRLK